MTLSTFSKATITALMIASTSASATIVEFTTSHGNFTVNLHDETTPITVSNFLKYINDGDYDNTVIHRVVPDFVMQAGGFEFTGNFPLTAIATDSTIQNEPVYSNVRGTIAMAKVSGNENSATSQWFVNVTDNSAGAPALDTTNGGFTVFGEIIAGMDNVDTITELSLCGTTPMPDYTAEQCSDSTFVPGTENFVTIETVTIIDSTVDTASSLNSVKNTLLSTATPVTPTPTPSSSSSGSIAWLGLFFTGLIALRRRFR
ncbi:peptidylprolyl isomerase [Colwellia sp. Arc7-635]|nr:peptidylprolyl isomerase [Colwellia sp. Arc7-635]